MGTSMSNRPGAGMVRVDMHIHTELSFDSLNRPGEIIRAAESLRLDHLVITDHNDIEGALLLHDIDPIRFIVGEEVKTREGADIIGIFLSEIIPKNTPARETCIRIREQGGVVYLPHPFDTSRSGGAAILPEIRDLIDVIEVHNARCLRAGVNHRAEDWATRYGKLQGAGSDAHTIGEIGRGFVEIPPFSADRFGFLAALSRGGPKGRTLSSPFCHVYSTYAKIRKKIPL